MTQQSLVIVESPTKARTISKILGKNFKVKASSGHIIDLPKKKLGIDIKKNFTPHYEILPEKRKIVKELQEEALKIKNVYLAPDPDREGEAIAWHLSNILNEVGIKSKRIEFHEVTKKAVKNAIENPREIDLFRVNAQQARRILDRIVGYKLSPLLWQKVKKGLSAGRVQSVAVRLISDRENEIEKFVPEEFWSISGKFSKIKSKDTFIAELVKKDNKKIKISNEEQINKIILELKQSDFIVNDIKNTIQKHNPSPPFITSTLQQEAVRRHGFSVKKTMMLAQELYEGIEIDKEPVGLITYMRTDSFRISEESQNQVREFIKKNYGNDYLPKSPPIYKSKSKNKIQDAHEAIRPTDINKAPDKIKQFLKEDQFKIYKLIWSRFVASQMNPAIFDNTVIEIKTDKYLFKVNFSKLKFTGFLNVYSDPEEKIEDNIIINQLKVGDKLKLHELIPKQNFTQPPPRYTEATLVKTLEEQNIGRPSTYAPIITTIQERGYVQKNGKFLIPTSLGRMVNEQLVNYFPNIVDVGFTSEMENSLDKIATGDQKWQEVMKNFYEPFINTLKIAKEKMSQILILSDEICEICGKKMAIRNGRFGEFLSCSGYPECNNKKPIIKRINLQCPLPNCDGEIIQRKSKQGKIFYGCSKYPSCNFVSWDQPTENLCPDCNSYMVLKFSKNKRLFLLCSNKDCKKMMNIKKK